MIAYTFKLEQAGKPPIVRLRSCADDQEATNFGHQLLSDWVDHDAVEISVDGSLVDLLRRRPQD